MIFFEFLSIFLEELSRIGGNIIKKLSFYVSMFYRNHLNYRNYRNYWNYLNYLNYCNHRKVCHIMKILKYYLLYDLK